VSKYLINSIGLALVAAGQSMIASAADMADVSGLQIISDTPQTTVSPGTIAAAELDVEGLPWDDRLHASTKTKTAQGTWTKKKGVDDTTRATIVKQLREKYPAPQAAATTGPTLTPPGSGAPVITLPGVGAPLTPYQELCAWLAANTGDGKAASAEWVAQTFASANTTLADLASADAGLLKQWTNAFRAALGQPTVA